MLLRDIIEDLYTRCPGAPDEALSSAYRDTVRRFLRKVNAWVIDSTIFTVGATTAEYVPTVPIDAEMHDFYNPQYALTYLNRLTREQAQHLHWPATGTARGARLAGVDTIILMPDPGTDVSADLTASLVLRPTRTALTIPDTLVKEYGDVFEYGALSIIYAIPGQPYSSMSGAAFYREMFLDLTDSMHTQARDGGMKNIVRTTKYYAPGSR